MDIIKEIENHVLNKYNQDEYNWQHNEFVTKYAIILAKKLNADVEIITIAARLHDIDYSRGPKYHTQDSAKYAFKLLTKMGYPTNKIKQVEETILCHTSSIVKTMNNPSKEGEILFDADKMWTMTPKGFARTIAHRYQNNKSYSFIIQQLQKSIGKFDELFFDLSRELIRKDRDICIKFMDNLIDI